MSDLELREEAIKVLTPLIDKNIALHNQIDNNNQQIEKLQDDISNLQQKIKDFPVQFEPLDRDKPIDAESKLSVSGVNLSCPKCGTEVANWYNYCPECGQRVKEKGGNNGRKS